MGNLIDCSHEYYAIFSSTATKSSVNIMKLYSVSDGPPSLAVRMLLAELQIPYELQNVNFNLGEHMTDEYAKVSLSVSDNRFVSEIE